ncbi:MAG: hypothetical protein AAF982_08180 [Pseudomonadota bacterium]
MTPLLRPRPDSVKHPGSAFSITRDFDGLAAAPPDDPAPSENADHMP